MDNSLELRSVIFPLHSAVLNNDVKKEILLHMPDEQLLKVCQVDTKTLKLCDENFWWMKFVKEFGTDLEESKKNGIEINYKKIYKQFRNLNDYELFFGSVEYGYIDLIKRLIELKRVDSRVLHAENDYALILATTNGHLDVVKYLIEHGADINVDNDYALRWASEYGKLNVVEYLIEHGANIHADDDCALLWSSIYGKLDVVKYLIEHGADIHANNDGALELASANGHLDVVKYLIENGADITILRNIKLPANITNYLKSISGNNNEKSIESL